MFVPSRQMSYVSSSCCGWTRFAVLERFFRVIIVSPLCDKKCENILKDSSMNAVKSFCRFVRNSIWARRLPNFLIHALWRCVWSSFRCADDICRVFNDCLNANLFIYVMWFERSSINALASLFCSFLWCWHYALFKFTWKRPSSMSPGRQSSTTREPDEIDYRISLCSVSFFDGIWRMFSACTNVLDYSHANISFQRRDDRVAEIYNFHLVIKYTFNPIWRGAAACSSRDRVFSWVWIIFTSTLSLSTRSSLASSRRQLAFDIHLNNFSKLMFYLPEKLCVLALLLGRESERRRRNMLVDHKRIEFHNSLLFCTEREATLRTRRGKAKGTSKRESTVSKCCGFDR